MPVVIEDLSFVAEPEVRGTTPDTAAAAPQPSPAMLRDQIRAELARAEMRAARLRAD